MYLHNITKGVDMHFTFEDGREFQVVYDGNIDHMNFHAMCTELVKDIDEIIDTDIAAKFNIEEKAYTFNAKILKKSLQRDAVQETIEVKITSPFKEVQLRDSFRIELAMKVKFYDYADDYKKLYIGDWICDGVTNDLSMSGIRIWSDHYLKEIKGAMYTIEFNLHKNAVYLIPVKLMRHSRNMTTRTYAYDYGFAFDFTNVPDKREKLFLAIMEAKLHGKF